MRLLFLLSILLLPASLWAQCGGTDLRATLTPEQNAEIATRLYDVPFPRGNHWIATKGDRQLNVIGTMHMDDPRFDDVTAGLNDIITQADLVMVEATLEDQKALEKAIATKPELAFLTGQTLIDMMPEEDWAALAQAAEQRGIPPFMAAKFQPWYLSLILAMTPCALKELANGARGLDHRILELAGEANVATASLEPYETIFKLFNNDPMEKQIEMLRLGVLPIAFAEDATATLIAQYFEQDHVAALEASRVITRKVVDMDSVAFDQLFDDFMALLVDQRNRDWIAPIEAAPGKRIVIAAGALHLGGEVGLLNLLKQRGYTLTQADF